MTTYQRPMSLEACLWFYCRVKSQYPENKPVTQSHVVKVKVAKGSLLMLSERTWSKKYTNKVLQCKLLQCNTISCISQNLHLTYRQTDEHALNNMPLLIISGWGHKKRESFYHKPEQNGLPLYCRFEKLAIFCPGGSTVFYYMFDLLTDNRQRRLWWRRGVTGTTKRWCRVCRCVSLHDTVQILRVTCYLNCQTCHIERAEAIPLCR